MYRGTNRSPENVRNHYAHNPESEELYALGYLLGELLFRLTAYARRYELDDRLREDYSKFLQCKGGYDGLLLDFFDLVDDDCEMRGIISELYTFRSVAGCEINYAREVTPLNIELVVDESASYNFIDHEGNETTEDVIVYYSLYLNY